MKNTKKGFTLVELLVVIAILAILASVAVVGYTSFITKAEKSNAETEAHQLETAIEAVIMIPGDAYVLGTTKGSDAVLGEDGAVVTPAVAPVTYYVYKTEAGVRVCTYDAETEEYTAISAAVAFDATTINADFAGLTGTITAQADGTLDYIYSADITVEIDLTK